MQLQMAIQNTSSNNL